MLHYKTDSSYSDPTAEAHKKRLAACLYKLYDVGVQSYSRHGEYYEKFAQRLDRREHVSACAEMQRGCGDKRSGDKVK